MSEMTMVRVVARVEFPNGTLATADRDVSDPAALSILGRLDGAETEAEARSLRQEALALADEYAWECQVLGTEAGNAAVRTVLASHGRDLGHLDSRLSDPGYAATTIVATPDGPYTDLNGECRAAADLAASSSEARMTAARGLHDAKATALACLQKKWAMRDAE